MDLMDPVPYGLERIVDVTCGLITCCAVGLPESPRTKVRRH